MTREILHYMSDYMGYRVDAPINKTMTWRKNGKCSGDALELPVFSSLWPSDTIW